LNTSRGFASAGVPLSRNTLFLDARNGTKFYVLFAEAFFKKCA